MDGRSALVGREAERARLAEAAERARRGEGSLLLLSGEAGVGKTRLVDEVAASSSALVLRGTASATAVTPYGPWSPPCARICVWSPVAWTVAAR